MVDRLLHSLYGQANKKSETCPGHSKISTSRPLIFSCRLSNRMNGAPVVLTSSCCRSCFASGFLLLKVGSNILLQTVLESKTIKQLSSSSWPPPVQPWICGLKPPLLPALSSTSRSANDHPTLPGLEMVWIKALVPCCSHQNTLDMDVHPNIHTENQWKAWLGTWNLQDCEINMVKSGLITIF